MTEAGDKNLAPARELIEQARQAGENWDYYRMCELAQAALAQLPNIPASDELAADAHMLAGKSHTVLGYPVKSQEHYEQALRILERTGEYGRNYANCELGLAQCSLLRSDLGTARLIWQRVLASSQAAGWRDIEAFVLYQQGQAQCNEGHTTDALSKLEPALAIYGELKDTRRQYHIQLIMGFALLQDGRLQDAYRLLAGCLAYYQEHGPQVSVGSCLTNLGNIALLHGDMAEARELFTQCRELPEAAPHNLGFCALNTGALDFIDGDLRKAHKHLMRARQIFEQTHYRAALILVHALLAARNIYLGELQAASNELQCARRLGEEVGGEPDGLHSGVHAVWYLVHDGLEQARDAWQSHLDSEQLTRAITGLVLAKLLSRLIDGAPGVELMPAARAQAQDWLVGLSGASILGESTAV